MVLLKSSFSRRYSNFKLKNVDSAQANTTRSRHFFDKLAKTVEFCCNSSHIFCLHFILFQEACKDTIYAGKTPRSVSLPGVTYFANISAKTNLSAKPFLPVYQGPRWVSFIEKKNIKNLVTLLLKLKPMNQKVGWMKRQIYLLVSLLH